MIQIHREVGELGSLSRIAGMGTEVLDFEQLQAKGKKKKIQEKIFKGDMSVA